MHDNRILMLNNEKKIVSSGFNIGLSQSKRDIIIRVDGHSKLDEYYLENCQSVLKEVDAV